MLTFEEIKKEINILLVDDDEDYINLVKMYFGGLGYNIDIAENGEKALEIIKKEKHQIILLDYFMPGMSGEDVVNKIREFNKQVIIIMQTGFAGQKPPIDTMKRLNIQNFHDKTEGIEKLNLEVISAVKIFQQQNSISVAKFRANAIAKLISSIAANIKGSLMSVSGSIEITNMMVSDVLDKDKIEKLNAFQESNKKNLEKVDRVLSTIMNAGNDEGQDVMLDTDIVEIVKSILEAEMKQKMINFDANVSLRTSSYITGDIKDIIFILCEIAMRVSDVTETKEIEFVITEDEEKWYFDIRNKDINKIDNNNLYILKNVTLSMKGAQMIKKEGSICIALSKK